MVSKLWMELRILQNVTDLQRSLRQSSEDIEYYLKGRQCYQDQTGDKGENRFNNLWHLDRDLNQVLTLAPEFYKSLGQLQILLQEEAKKEVNA